MSSKLEEGTSRLSIQDRSSPADGDASGSSPPPEQSSTSKPKRVRTGCLTCRERHLKCDEGMPICQNCKKSNRQCKRGVRLNFIDTKVEETQLVPQTSDWNVTFQDESRDIASEYKGGSERYGTLEEDAMDIAAEPPPPRQAPLTTLQSHPSPPAPRPPHQPLPPMHTPPMLSENYGTSASADSRRHSTGSATSYTSYQSYHPYPEPQRQTTPSHNDVRDCLNEPEEVLYMQVFVEEVGLWMDSMDPYKHFSRILPFYALAEPMLLNAFLACGARHLNLINPAFSEDKAIHYYDTATRALLRSLQNPNRDTIICATAACILNVYEVMTERALQRMNHIAGARALIKECGWNARSAGIGSACFWLNVGMEVWSCLHFNWQVAWNPDDWGVDMTMEKDTRAGNEEAWTHKILYVSAKVANLRATIPRFQDSNPTAQAMRQADRSKQWENLKQLCDTWNENVPRTMHPAAYLLPHQKQGKSLFPEVWLIKRASIMGRLFYHTSMCLLGQMNPQRPEGDPEMTEMTQYHSRMICGIVAHNKDRGVASAGIRCISIGAECLTDFKEQEEILTILRKIKKETGWRIDFLEPELRKKWGWTDEYVRHQQHMHSILNTSTLEPPVYAPQSHPSPPQPSPPLPSAASIASGNTSTSGAPAMPQIPRGIVNPTMRMADFNAPNHAYQNYWVAPNPGHSDAHYLYRLTDNHYHG